jgi:hypothetical protein
VNRITWVEHNSDYIAGTVGRFMWCEITRINNSPFWVFKPKYKYMIRTLVRSAGTVETHTRSYGGFYSTIDEAKREAEVILDTFLDEAIAVFTEAR